LIERIEPGVLFDDEYGPEEDLNRVPGLQGSELARQFVLSGFLTRAIPRFLSSPAVKDGLPRLAESVEFVEFYLP